MAEGEQQQQQQNNGQQQQQAPWYQGIDQETIGHIENKGWKKDDPKALVVELTKAWKGLERHFGAPADQILRLPAKPDDEAGWKAVRQRLGMPAEAKDYDFSGVKFADGTDLEAGFTDRMRSALHKAGVAKDAAADIVREVVAFHEESGKAEDTERVTRVQAERAALQKEWGTNFDFNRLTAMQGAKRLGVDEATVQQLENQVGYAKTMEMFRRIGAGTTEDTFVESGKGGAPVTQAGVVARLAELEGDRDFMARYLKGGAKEVAEMNALIAQKVGVAA